MNKSRASRSGPLSRVLLLITEIVCWTFGLALLGYFVQMTVAQRWHAQRDIERFMLTATARAADGVRGAPVFPAVTAPDQSLWSAARRTAYQASADLGFQPPIAILRVPSVSIEVPVYPGTSDAVLNRGAGWINGTARVEDGGNIGIAAHRDSYFRALKDVRKGELIELQTPFERRRFRISSMSIVLPSDTTALQLTQKDSLTLVTCYPFYFVGHAPQRYIVRAVAIEKADRDIRTE